MSGEIALGFPKERIAERFFVYAAIVIGALAVSLGSVHEFKSVLF